MLFIDKPNEISWLVTFKGLLKLIFIIWFIKSIVAFASGLIIVSQIVLFNYVLNHLNPGMTVQFSKHPYYLVSH